MCQKLLAHSLFAHILTKILCVKIYAYVGTYGSVIYSRDTYRLKVPKNTSRLFLSICHDKCRIDDNGNLGSPLNVKKKIFKTVVEPACVMDTSPDACAAVQTVLVGYIHTDPSLVIG